MLRTGFSEKHHVEKTLRSLLCHSCKYRLRTNETSYSDNEFIQTVQTPGLWLQKREKHDYPGTVLEQSSF